MKRAKAILLAALLFSGCASIQQRETVVVCKAVDTVTTVELVRQGAAELNPVMDVFLRWGYGPFVVAQAAIVTLVWHYWHDLTDTEQKVALALACAPGGFNAAQIAAR